MYPPAVVFPRVTIGRRARFRQNPGTFAGKLRGLLLIHQRTVNGWRRRTEQDFVFNILGFHGDATLCLGKWSVKSGFVTIGGDLIA